MSAEAAAGDHGFGYTFRTWHRKELGVSALRRGLGLTRRQPSVSRVTPHNKRLLLTAKSSLARSARPTYDVRSRIAYPLGGGIPSVH